MIFLAYILLTFIIVAIVRVSSRKRTAALSATVTGTEVAAARRFARSITLRNVGALAVAGAVLGLLKLVNDAQPGWYGLPLMLAPGLAAAAGLLVFALTPTRVVSARSSRRSADLLPRRPWSYGPAWGFLLPLIAAAAVIAFAIVAGLASSPQPDGGYRSITVGSSTSGPYPGWFYGLPLIGLTVLLTAATLFALGRIASSPRSERFGEIDRIVRVLATRVVMQLSSGALFLYFGGVLLFAGWATTNAASVFAPDGGGVVSNVQPAAFIGLSEVVVGLLVALLGGVLVVLSVLDATRQPLGRGAGTGSEKADAASARPA
ncbi:hypothetical protein [Cryobacterium sp. Y11]|uniref:hypothetical protein n=1 Tax=Cryobacterium sp. Y11 TaxID=2045016 RepID=UPI000CE3C8AF|nr:hypothetical protein [Cryobacterium sp. Y11]